MLNRRMAWTVALVATFTMTVSYVDRSALGVLAVAVCKALDISNQQYGWITSAFSMAYLVGTPLSGWWIDRVGARRGLIGSVLVWSGVAALHALVPGFWALFALRIALGIAEGPSFPGAAQTVQRVLPPQDRERGFGVLFTGSSVGFMLVPPFAAYVFAHWGWRVALLITSLAGLIWLPLWIAVTRSRAVREKLDAAEPEATAVRPDLRQMVTNPLVLRALLSIFAAAPIFGFSQAWGAKYLAATFKVAQQDVGWYLFLPPLMFDAGAVLFGHFASLQRRPEGVPARGLYAGGLVLAVALLVLPMAPTPWQAMLLLGVANAGGGALYTITSADLLSRMPVGSVSFAAGIMAGAQSLALIIANPLIGRAVDRFGNYDTVAYTLGMWVIPGSLAWLLWRPALRLVVRVRAPLPRAELRSGGDAGRSDVPEDLERRSR